MLPEWMCAVNLAAISGQWWEACLAGCLLISALMVDVAAGIPLLINCAGQHLLGGWLVCK